MELGPRQEASGGRMWRQHPTAGAGWTRSQPEQEDESCRSICAKCPPCSVWVARIARRCSRTGFSMSAVMFPGLRGLGRLRADQGAPTATFRRSGCCQCRSTTQPEVAHGCRDHGRRRPRSRLEAAPQRSHRSGLGNDAPSGSVCGDASVRSLGIEADAFHLFLNRLSSAPSFQCGPPREHRRVGPGRRPGPVGLQADTDQQARRVGNGLAAFAAVHQHRRWPTVDGLRTRTGSSATSPPSRKLLGPLSRCSALNLPQGPTRLSKPVR